MGSFEWVVMPCHNVARKASIVPNGSIIIGPDLSWQLRYDNIRMKPSGTDFLKRIQKMILARMYMISLDMKIEVSPRLPV